MLKGKKWPYYGMQDRVSNKYRLLLSSRTVSGEEIKCNRPDSAHNCKVSGVSPYISLKGEFRVMKHDDDRNEAKHIVFFCREVSAS
jgi:hypothetical protein